MAGFLEWARGAIRSGSERRSQVGQRRRWRLTVEALEPRNLPSGGAGGGYLLNGYQWSNPGHITYSIVPDGVQWDHGITNLNTTFNGKFGDGPWQAAIARALATWEAAANINLVPVADSGLPFGTAGLSQGDPRFGDIRFGGYAFPGDSTTLARTYYPPPDSGTASGDDDINTTMPFGIGSSYDFYSVMLHETGLALGLAEVSDPAEVMYGTYTGIRTGLAAGDIAGIQALYGPRTADAFQQAGQGLGLASAIAVTPSLNPAYQATLGNLSLPSIGATEYFSVVAPSFAGAGLQVTAAAGNISLLSPKVTILDSTGRALTSAGNPSAWSNDVTAALDQLVPGERYYVAVTGATSDVFSVGGYQLNVEFTGAPATSGATPSSPPAPASSPSGLGATPAAATTPVPSSPANANAGTNANTPAPVTTLGMITGPTVGTLSQAQGNAVHDFRFRAARAGVYQVAAPGASIRVLDGSGNAVAGGSGVVLLRSGRARAWFTAEIGTTAAGPAAGGSVTIAPVMSGLVARRLGGATGLARHFATIHHRT